MSAKEIFVIVDDSREDRFFLKRMLQRAFPDCEFVEFLDVDEALAFLLSSESRPPATVIVDINMPRMSGFEFAELYAEAASEGSDAARIYLTSHLEDPEEQARIATHPAIAGWIAKPHRIEDLRAAFAGDRRGRPQD